ncbi:MAG: sigma-70 family RNA polymerase sigma factor [Candidatus Methanomethylophilaceae archaeon]|nr:sigma-70 family RNA polymerase sigma factor [Candidatus Methanomethylophilaceae archaeon]
MNDESIIALFNERSEQAITSLSERFGTSLLAVAENLLGNKEDAEECVQDTFLAVWNRIPPEQPTSLSAYVFRILRNIAIKRYHEKNAKKRNAVYDIALEELEDSIPASPSAEEEADEKALSEAIDRFLSGLKPEDRVLFIRRYWFSESISDLAHRLQIRDHAVSVRLSRIRRKLRAYLEKECISL